MRSLPLLAVAVLVAGCASFRSPPPATDRFVVFFDPGSAALSPAANLEISRSADAIKATHPVHVAIAAYPKAVAGDGPDVSLGDPRFDAVKGALVANGVDAQILARAMLSDLEVKAGTVGNRRVEIRLFKN